MVDPPQGTVTFLFTDIEGSTHRWESDPDGMQTALAVHDQLLRTAIEAHGGWLFKHTGDGVCAAFEAAQAAVSAAVEAQRGLELPVRMGIATGDAESRDGDYFGLPLNRAARVMSAGHGGQILLADSTMQIIKGVDTIDLGQHHLRDISEPIGIFQVSGEGLGSEFAPLKTADRELGNLPISSTSLVGRETEMEQLVELVRNHRLVTLTGVGGVGKTRLATEVGFELVGDFVDGVWLVELAPVLDPADVPAALATVLGIASKPGMTVTESIVDGLSGRRLLIVLDNCEHVLHAVADIANAILASVETVHLIATSREGLWVAAEHLWAVSPLEVGVDSTSAAVRLFEERAMAVIPTFTLGVDLYAVVDICRQLDGLALAIELAAARMVSMSAVDIRDRLDDRFRLLSGARGGENHQQTLHQTVQWSYDLLEQPEQALLNRCSVFSDGFDLAAAAHFFDDGDEYDTLDLLDSLVRKSLVTVERASGHARYGMLETIRQFAQVGLDRSGTEPAMRSRHAAYFAGQVQSQWEIWDGPRQGEVLVWVELEMANLRSGFRWAVEQGDVACAGAIAAHTSIIAFVLQKFEPVGWVEEILPKATAVDIPQLPRLYTAAAICAYAGRPQLARTYIEAAVDLEPNPRYDPFAAGWSGLLSAVAYRYTDQIDRSFVICTGLAKQSGLARVIGLCGLLYNLAVEGRFEEARAIADETLAVARDHQSPFWIAWALEGHGRAFAESDPTHSLAMFRQCLDYSLEHHQSYWTAVATREVAILEAVHGELEQAFELFDTAMDSFHQAGNVAHLATSFAGLASCFSRLGEFEIAATFYGTTTPHAALNTFAELPAVVDGLRDVLSPDVFDKCVTNGASMDPNQAIAYAHKQIQRARSLLSTTA